MGQAGEGQYISTNVSAQANAKAHIGLARTLRLPIRLSWLLRLLSAHSLLQEAKAATVQRSAPCSDRNLPVGAKTLRRPSKIPHGLNNRPVHPPNIPTVTAPQYYNLTARPRLEKRNQAKRAH